MPEFNTPTVSTLKVPVAVNMDKNIAKLGEIISGYKIISIQGFKADGTLIEAKSLIDTILTEIGGGIYNFMKIKKVITSFATYTDADYIEVEFISDDIAPILNGTYTPINQALKSDVDSIFDGTYQVQGTMFTAADIDNIFEE